MAVDATAIKIALLTSRVGTLLRLSGRARVQRTRLSLIVNGHVTPRAEECARIAKVLGVGVDHLFPPDQQSQPADCPEYADAEAAR